MEERINNLIIKSINLTKELREMKAEIKALEKKVLVKDVLELSSKIIEIETNPILFHK